MANEIYDSTWWGNTIQTASSIGTSTEMIQGQFNLTKLGDEEVTNGDFATDLSGWVLQNVDASNTITWEANGARVISVGVNISLRQLGILEVGKTYKLTCDLSITSGGLGIDSSTAGSTINMAEGFNEIIFTANDNRLIIKRITGNDNCLIDNISVKEVRAEEVEAVKCLADAIHRIGIQDIQN
jgi:hypothetical protein